MTITTCVACRPEDNIDISDRPDRAKDTLTAQEVAVMTGIALGGTAQQLPLSRNEGQRHDRFSFSCFACGRRYDLVTFVITAHETCGVIKGKEKVIIAHARRDFGFQWELLYGSEEQIEPCYRFLYYTERKNNASSNKYIFVLVLTREC